MRCDGWTNKTLTQCETPQPPCKRSTGGIFKWWQNLKQPRSKWPPWEVTQNWWQIAVTFSKKVLTCQLTQSGIDNHGVRGMTVASMWAMRAHSFLFTTRTHMKTMTRYYFQRTESKLQQWKTTIKTNSKISKGSRSILFRWMQSLNYT